MTRAARQTEHVTIRDAQSADFSRVQEIYAHHVKHGLGTFEEVPPDTAEMRRRYEGWRSLGLPYIVAEDDAGVQGFAYGAPFRARSAYRHTVEDSIYVAPEAQRRRIGLLLLETLIERCTTLGFRQMIAVIGDSGNIGSVGLHQRCGFRRVGHLQSVGFKFGQWVDCVIMQRALGTGDADLPPPN